jgi:hypothetical protein
LSRVAPAGAVRGAVLGTAVAAGDHIVGYEVGS